jgi:hypothetical protein
MKAPPLIIKSSRIHMGVNFILEEKSEIFNGAVRAPFDFCKELETSNALVEM